MDPEVVLAAQHVDSGRRIVLRQHQIIARKRKLGLATDSAKSLLTTFEASQAMFEEHLRALLDEQDHKPKPATIK